MPPAEPDDLAGPHSSLSTLRLRSVFSAGSPGPEGTVELLVSRLAEEMAQRWRTGECPPAEVFLARHPELADQPEAAVQLIHEEICLRQELGQEPSSVEVMGRFPQWRAQLQVLFECHRLLEPQFVEPRFPVVGDTWAGCRLLAELERGAVGRVFLAVQLALAERPVVLKFTPRDGSEHIALARLQHTHIMPLYAMQDDPQRHLRALCMPYFGGVTLAQLLRELRAIPLGQRTGQHVVDVLDRAQASAAVAVPVQGSARIVLARATYVEAVCGLTVCLADALQYAHERGLVHLDLKPSNILLAADGQPLLLDFHLARAPLDPEGPPPEWLGGTPDYMSPEQRAALDAVRKGRPITQRVDGRSDVYSLGLVLYEALGGTLPLDRSPQRQPGMTSTLAGAADSCPGVTVGLTDIIAKCLTPDVPGRYASAAALAADLRRHLSHRPLCGVANRSLAERWRKWRRRQPMALILGILLLAVLALAGTGGAIYFDTRAQRRHEAQQALEEGRQRRQQRDHAEAVRVLARGKSLAEALPGGRELANRLDAELRLARRAGAAQELNTLANRVRFLAGMEDLSWQAMQQVAVNCRSVWDARGPLVESRGAELEPEWEERIHTDLLDLATLGADLRLRLASGSGAAEARRDALRWLTEAEEVFGPNAILSRERHRFAPGLSRNDPAPQTAWEHYALGRSLLREGQLEPAAAEFERAVALRPQDFWPNFYQGICAYRRHRPDEAISAFRVCIALAPESAECFYNRGLAHATLGQPEQALADYDRALQLQPALAPALLNRGILHFEQKRLDHARTDLQLALKHGADPATVYYNLAVVHLAQDDRAPAVTFLQQALAQRPDHAAARALLERLQKQR